MTTTKTKKPSRPAPCPSPNEAKPGASSLAEPCQREASPSSSRPDARGLFGSTALDRVTSASRRSSPKMTVEQYRPESAASTRGEYNDFVSGDFRVKIHCAHRTYWVGPVTGHASCLEIMRDIEKVFVGEAVLV